MVPFSLNPLLHSNGLVLVKEAFDFVMFPDEPLLNRREVYVVASHQSNYFFCAFAFVAFASFLLDCITFHEQLSD